MAPSNPIMTPVTGERLVRFVGDMVRFTLQNPGGGSGWSARLRTNLGRAAVLRREIIAAHAGGPVHAGASWRDLPMQKNGDSWQIELPLAETGFFKAKAYLLDPKGWQHWPDGPDVGISVHPDFARTTNTIYCAFTRLLGATKKLSENHNETLEGQLQTLEKLGYATLPPSGTFRDLARQLPHIVQKLGCRILHLLPVFPTPTTYARFGRYGSPYAALDLTAIDPSLVEFDRRTTGVDQFGELTCAAHSLGARVFLDIIINHTGWGSVLQERHPEYFLRQSDGTFASPGAWGTVWEDLVELKQDNVALWDKIAGALLTWCRRGVDGFRCDAGYKIPVPAWQYIIARVQDEFPETIFLLEGLGGSWEATENLLTDGGMQWAYSELFQNYSGRQVADYLDYASRQSLRFGTYIHYSETHDNDRLAKKGRAWSLLRNRLCALASINGGFGFTCGAEWLAAEKIRVHGCTGLAWNNPDNIVPELAQLNRLLAGHPCFFDGAKLARLSPPDAPVYALRRDSAEGKDSVLVLVNTDPDKPNALLLADSQFPVADFKVDLLGQPLPKPGGTKEKPVYVLGPGAAYCLAPAATPQGLSGEDYRRARSRAAWAAEALGKIIPVETADGFDWRWLAESAGRSPANLLAAISAFARRGLESRLNDLLVEVEQGKIYPRVVPWTLPDRHRVTLVPPDHWLLIQDDMPFRATLELGGRQQNIRSIAVADGQVACFPPAEAAGDAVLSLERFVAVSERVTAAIRFLSATPDSEPRMPDSNMLALLTNGIGGMARLCADLGRVNSKYDCVLGANLHPSLPVDRHVLVKRIRVWVDADGFLSPLNAGNLSSFTAGPPAVWQFVANAGDGRTVQIELQAEMVPGKNTTVFRFNRPTEKRAVGKQLPAEADVRVTVRVDIEDRNFHRETRRNAGADFHFSTHCHPLSPAAELPRTGFAFTPAPDRQLRVFASDGEYHPEPEWSENIPHPVEQSRGQTGGGDAYSPGWFELPLPKGASVSLVATAETDNASLAVPTAEAPAAPDPSLTGARIFEDQLNRAARAFVVRRGDGKTVIAGYPWFLDWGRDSLICARGLLAAGLVEDVKQMLLIFAGFERDGTLPNTIHGADVSNRDTSDAPLWFGVACEETAARDAGTKFYEATTATDGRTIGDILRSIAVHYAKGTPNGIGLDADSALIWSPGHFTWMDTNHPAGTPREGYPVEIQVLWIRLLRQLEKISPPAEQAQWHDLAERAMSSLEELFWLENQGWYADVLLAGRGVRAHGATPADALRSNGLLAVSLGLVTGDRARRCVAAAAKFLVVPGALRSLAPLPVSVPQPVTGNDGRPLNDPLQPYWPCYEGDEDTRRKPAYHNGTAWTWTFPSFCEALARAWDCGPEAVAAAKAYLGSVDQLMRQGCAGQIPEILDGDAPHRQRGCDAQAWSATEALRVWKWLNELKR